MLAGCASYGPKVSLPNGNPPYTEKLEDPRYAEAARAASEHLRRAHKELAVPALSAAVSIDGKVVWAATVGWADLEAGKAATPETQFRIGSTSKAMTGTILARLVDEGKVDLDKAIGAVVPDLPNRAWAPLTPRQLASHTAGIVGYEENRDIWGLWHSVVELKPVPTVRESLDVFDSNKLLFVPGTGFHYSSYDTTLLAAVIESASGKSYLEALEAYVAAPRAAYGLMADFQDREVPNRAQFYDRADKDFRRWRHVDHSYKWAGGGLIATSTDLVKVGGAWFDGSFISPQTSSVFWTPQKISGGEVNPQSYALCWRSNQQTRLFGQNRPVHNIHHGGVSKGAYSWLNLYPEFRLAVALNANARLEEFVRFIEVEYPITRAFLERLESLKKGGE
jgi:CubicO group peptidase (beta-lactamase class C family)